jgi:hypothetical protein
MTYRSDALLTPPEARLFFGIRWAISRHEAIAAAAEQCLTDTTREAVARITAPLGPGVSLSSLAGWADTIKRRPPTADDDADTVAFLNDDRNKGQPTWHYVDIPCQADGYDRAKYPEFTRDDDVVQMIAEAVRVFTAGSTRFSQLNALRLIVHLVGDVHQPVHVGCSYIDKSSTPAKLVLDPAVAASQHLHDDHGGGYLLLPGNGNLHGYWDGKIGSVGAGDDGGDDHDHERDFADASPELRALFVQKLVDMTAALPRASAGVRAAGDPARWAEEWATKSMMAAREAYASLRITGASGNTNFKVSWEGKPAYDARCRPVANERLASAVRNLADLLNRILG